MAADGTRERIEACAMKEFLDKGFHGASLRQIVKEAGVTTGAFYKYYPTKEALFEGLVKPVADHILDMVDENYDAFVQQDAEEQVGAMSANSHALTRELVGYLYENRDVVTLLLTASEGTSYADFVHSLASREEKSTLEFAKLMREHGIDVPELDGQFVHMVASGLFSAIFEVVLHDMDEEQAMRRIETVEEFYTGGWERVLGVDFPK